MLKLERWLAVPFAFGGLFFVAVSARWLTASIERARDAYGQGQVIGFHLLLVWQAAQRIAVVFVVTVAALPFVSPIRRSHIIYIASAAVAMEFLAEFILSTLVGERASRTLQLTATAIGYVFTLVASGVAFRKLDHQRPDAA